MSDLKQMQDSSNQANDAESKDSAQAGRFIRIISDPETIKILSDKTRLKILRALSDGPPDGMTVPELAKELNVAPPSLYHHIDLLFKHDLLRERTEKQKRRTTTYYMRSAPVFIIYHMDSADECSGTTLELIEQAWGFKVDDDKRAEIRSRLATIQNRQVKMMDTLVSHMQAGFDKMQLLSLLTLMSHMMLQDDKEFQENLKVVGEVVKSKFDWA